MSRKTAGAMRKSDVEWFEKNRATLAAEFKGRWIVVLKAKVLRSFDSEESAIRYALTEFGIDVASIFQATPSDPFEYVGDLRS